MELKVKEAINRVETKAEMNSRAIMDISTILKKIRLDIQSLEERQNIIEKNLQIE